ncbi:hypothetical protein ACXR0O_04715 [Verrucomicrobiota bacterium sgz303538]
MSNRLRFGLIALTVLFVFNIGYRVWASWGLITVDVTDAPASQVIHSIEKQAGVRIRTNLPSDKTVTMHVKKVPFLHALDVLSASTEANWSVAYVTAPNKQDIETALSTFSNGQEMEGWKRFSLPPMRGMSGVEEGTSDPREENWETKAASEGTLHAYLEQASHTLSAQFWAPEQWNPAVTSAPKSGKVEDVLPKLAKVVHGQSAEVFLLRGRPQRTRDTAEGEQNNGEGTRRERGQLAGRGGFGGQNEEMRKIMEERALAQIEKLPADKREEARAEFEERKKFFEEMAQLTPEERKAKIEERIEKEMGNGSRASRMDSNMTKRGAMQTAEQRADRYRGYLDRKSQNN